jgi:membrane associated rhomboid family serine protease
MGECSGSLYMNPAVVTGTGAWSGLCGIFFLRIFFVKFKKNLPEISRGISGKIPANVFFNFLLPVFFPFVL